MSTAQKFLIVLQIGGFLIVLAYLGFHLYRSKQETHKYKLYALRDQIIFLVATKELKEDSLVFQVFYNALIQTIREVKAVRLWSIAKASVAARSVLQQQRQEQLLEQVNASSPSVKAFVNDFCQTMMEIAVANSPLLVLFIRLANHNAVSKTGQYIRKLRIFLNEQQQYDAYRYFERSRFAT